MIVSHSYHSQSLRQLIEKSEKSGWSISEINWDQTPIVPMGVTQPDYIDMISQLYHAELFTLKICARLITEVPDFQAIRFICAQMNEEARHAQAYATYIAMLGKMNPINEKLATEARHSGFGFMYLKDKLPLLAQSGKTEIIKWIESLWSDWKIANEDRYILEGGEILRTSNEELDSRLKIQHRVFEKIGLI